MSDVVEVVVRLGDTVVDVTHVAADGGYRIGSAPGVELAVAIPGLTRFPLVDTGLVLRLPAGIPAVANGHTLREPTLRLARGASVALHLGLLDLTVTRLALPDVPVPRPPIERRPYYFGAVALVAHLIVWAFAMRFGDLERLPSPETAALRPTRVHVPDPPEVPKQAPAPATVATAEPAAPARAAARDQEGVGAQHAGMFDGLRDLHAITGTVDIRKALAEVGPLYNEHDANAGGFGNSQHFDPTGRPDFQTVPSGDYGTVSSGYSAGEDYFPGFKTPKPHDPAIAMCAVAGCNVDGALERGAIDEEVAKRFVAFAACYRRYAGGARGDVTIGFEITAAGKVRHTQGQGLDHTAGCVAEAASKMLFAAADTPTQATYVLSFRPPR